jgi:hypothetical protein
MTGSYAFDPVLLSGRMRESLTVIDPMRQLWEEYLI